MPAGNVFPQTNYEESRSSLGNAVVGRIELEELRHVWLLAAHCQGRIQLLCGTRCCRGEASAHSGNVLDKNGLWREPTDHLKELVGQLVPLVIWSAQTREGEPLTRRTAG
jgi:hypothetical protein